MKITANDGKVYTLPTNPVWNGGPPPEAGWWPASTIGKITVIRWYDKKRRGWSQPATPFDDERDAAFRVLCTTVFRENKIQWADRWWLKGGK